MKSLPIVVAVLAVLLGGTLYFLRQETPPPEAAEPSSIGPGETMPVRPVEALASGPAATPSDVPPDVPAEEWQRMKAALAATPDGEQQLERVGRYLTYQHRARKWQASKAAGEGVAARAELAQYLLEAMPGHVARREMTAGEAQQIATALLQDRISDPAALQYAVRAQLEKVKAAQPAPDAGLQAEAQARMAAYQRQEAAIVAQWQALPEAQRDPQWLEEQLEAARRAALTPLAP